MCTVVMSVRPGAEVPVLLAGIRDEFIDRPWRLPAEHWPTHPGLVGGLDLQAGGTWLAVAPAKRVAAVLNGKGHLAHPAVRRSRGELPLRAAADGFLDLAEEELRGFDPFHLVLAELTSVRVWSWDGDRFVARAITPGVHLLTSAGLDSMNEPRVAYFLSRFEARPRPAPAPREPCDQAWGEWLALVDGDGLDTRDERAMIVRNRAAGRSWGSTSATLVALRTTGLRYDFSAAPGDAAAWETVLEPLDWLPGER